MTSEKLLPTRRPVRREFLRAGMAAMVAQALTGIKAPAHPETASYKDRCLKDLLSQIPQILASQDLKTGRFGSGIWVVIDQNVLLPLAVAWAHRDPRNPYYHSEQVLQAITWGGNALIDAQDSTGKWIFRKKDGSTWGTIYQPWTYSRWARAFQLVGGAMPAAARAQWGKALLLGYAGIAAELRQRRDIRNMPAHQAMGLYFAGMVFRKPEWRALAVAYLHRVAAAQYPDGYWTEHSGPVVLYGTVYVEALGTYEAVSNDDALLPVLRRSAVFHAHFTYPDGTDVETIDERNPYWGKVRIPNTGFTFSPEGRGYLRRQIQLLKGVIPADDAASLLRWGGEGDAVDCAAGDFDYTLPSGKATVCRRRPWFLTVSAFTAPLSTNRFIQDRQNFVSVFHDRVGLILGGGNTKLQPLWSNFTIGDVRLLHRTPGDENPNFIPPPGLQHVPTSARLFHNGALGVELFYGDHRGRIALRIINGRRLEYVISCGETMSPHVTLLPRMGKPVRAANGEATVLSSAPFEWKPGAWIEHAGVRFMLPPATTVRWPLLPHDPYTKDGHAEAAQGRIVLELPAGGERTIVIEV